MLRCAVMRRRCSWLIVVPLILVFALVFAACGTNGSATGSTPPGSTATATQGQSTKNGCPNPTVVTTAPPAANVVLTNKDTGTTVNAKKGDSIQIDLPFGHLWQGPLTVSQNLLTAQGPAGYAYPSAKACVWNFLATGAGTAHLSFEGRPICQKNEACPMYIIAVLLTVNIKS